MRCPVVGSDERVGGSLHCPGRLVAGPGSDQGFHGGRGRYTVYGFRGSVVQWGVGLLPGVYSYHGAMPHIRPSLNGSTVSNSSSQLTVSSPTGPRFVRGALWCLEGCGRFRRFRPVAVALHCTVLHAQCYYCRSSSWYDCLPGPSVLCKVEDPRSSM